MTITRACGCAVLGLLAFVAAAATSAQERGLYVGASMGIANFPGDATINAFGVTLTDDEDPSPSLLAQSVDAGFRFNRWFATEIGYVDLGEASVTLRDSTGNNAVQGELHYGVKGPTVSFVGFMPFGKWDPLVRIGLIFPDVDLALDGTAGAASFSVRGESNAARAFYGIGIGYHFTERWNMKLEIDYYDGLGDKDTVGEANIITAMLGAAFKF